MYLQPGLPTNLSFETVPNLDQFDYMTFLGTSETDKWKR